MKESALAKNYLNILNVSETSQAGKQLLNWTIPELAGPVCPCQEKRYI